MTRVTSIRLPDELIDRLDRIARSLERSRGWVIRRALVDYVQQREANVIGMGAALNEAEGDTPQPTPLENVIAALELMIEEQNSETSSGAGQPRAP